jgi:hypothetical protein
MAVWWQKTSSPPPSCVMKPKPFASLNHFTVPVAITLELFSSVRSAEVAVPDHFGSKRRDGCIARLELGVDVELNIAVGAWDPDGHLGRDSGTAS